MAGSMNDFSQGVILVFRGIAEFLRHPRLWRFVIVPLVLVSVIYFWLFYVFLAVWLPQLQAAVRDFFIGSWFEFLYRCTEFLISASFYLFLVLVTAFTAGNLYELLGGIFFSRMVRDYETNILHCKIEKLSFGRDLSNLTACGIFSLVTLILYFALFIAGFFLPVVAPLATIPFIGYRYAVIYTSEAAFNDGHKLSEIPVLYRGRSGLLYGFGSMTFLLFLVPVLPIFFIPGLVIGGTLMYHRRHD